ncbi:phytanoyl-CoA dioxygenase family protein [Stachybotrys elegans]|uniref:Phytanoyl-CoA dioxygenase family protein n=1 Tax=Stachybotrys elegans TaxID=80388 RepID=A0A8K0WNE4_9HYPO|nr:phytanoyl-CoA dioxygenase family protein [Stachybotrys elegans]
MARTYENDAPVGIKLTDEERDSGVMSDKNLYDAIEAFFTDGLVVIENAIDVALIDKLNERMLKDTKKLLSGDGEVHFKYGAAAGGNLSQVPPWKKWLFPEIYANKHATRVISNILGPKPEVHFIRTNTLIATDERQKVHADLRFEHPEHPFAIAFNTCLIDVGPENGSTELWLGTQNTNLDYHGELGEPMIAQDKLDERRKVRGPIYPRLKKGSVVLRDLRLWHAGMPNPTSETRIMLAIVYYAAWYKNGVVTQMPVSLKPTIEALEEYGQHKIAVEWVPDEGYDYLKIKFSNNFSSTLTPWVWEKIQHVKTVKGY